MIVEAARFIKGDDQERLVPLGTGADGVVNVLEQLLAGGDQTGGMHGVGLIAAAGRVDEGEFGQTTGGCVGVKLGNVFDVGVGGATFNGPREEQGIDDVVLRVVVGPGVIGLG